MADGNAKEVNGVPALWLALEKGHTEIAIKQ